MSQSVGYRDYLLPGDATSVHSALGRASRLSSGHSFFEVHLESSLAALEGVALSLFTSPTYLGRAATRLVDNVAQLDFSKACAEAGEDLCCAMQTLLFGIFGVMYVALGSLMPQSLFTIFPPETASDTSAERDLIRQLEAERARVDDRLDELAAEMSRRIGTLPSTNSVRGIRGRLDLQERDGRRNLSRLEEAAQNRRLLQERLGQQEEAISGLRETVNGAAREEQLTALAERVTPLEEERRTFSETLSNQGRSLTQLGERITPLERFREGLLVENRNRDQTITDLETRLGNAATSEQLTRLTERVTALETEQNSLSNSIGELSGGIEELREQLRECVSSEEFTRLQNIVSGLQEKVNGMRNKKAARDSIPSPMGRGQVTGGLPMPTRNSPGAQSAEGAQPSSAPLSPPLRSSTRGSQRNNES